MVDVVIFSFIVELKNNWLDKLIEGWCSADSASTHTYDIFSEMKGGGGLDLPALS